MKVSDQILLWRVHSRERSMATSDPGETYAAMKQLVEKREIGLLALHGTAHTPPNVRTVKFLGHVQYSYLASGTWEAGDPSECMQAQRLFC